MTAPLEPADILAGAADLIERDGLYVGSYWPGYGLAGEDGYEPGCSVCVLAAMLIVTGMEKRPEVWIDIDLRRFDLRRPRLTDQEQILRDAARALAEHLGLEALTRWGRHGPIDAIGAGWSDVIGDQGKVVAELRAAAQALRERSAR